MSTASAQPGAAASDKPAAAARRRRTSLLALVVMLAAVAAAAVMVATSSPGPQSLAARTTQVAAGLRCPTCDGESAADSNSPLARSMRTQIRTDLRHGWSEQRIRGWFAARYGQQIVLGPPAAGAGLVLWVVPALALLAGLAVLLLRRPGAATGQREGAARATPITTRRVAVAALVFLVVGAGVPTAVWARQLGATPAAAGGIPANRTQRLLAAARAQDARGQHNAAIASYRQALRLQPSASGARTMLAFDLLRAGHPEQAIPLVRPVTRSTGGTRALALLVLGLAQRAEGSPRADGTLRSFLRLAPHHPAADQVRRLLREDGQ